jgi:hypothetical protein
VGLFSAVFQGGSGESGVFCMVFCGEILVFGWWVCGVWVAVFCGLNLSPLLKYFCGNLRVAQNCGKTRTSEKQRQQFSRFALRAALLPSGER